MKTITCICEVCKQPFEKAIAHIKYGRKVGENPGRFCSPKCRNQHFSKSRATSITVACAFCGKPFSKFPSQVKRSANHFCSRSCSGTYNNTHKTYGTRRSKLEVHIEQQLRIDFPSLELICNGKEAIGSELDFYFPQLRLAIELNGIFHYEPIYGPDKLERIQVGDQQKFQSCITAGIELCVIDASTAKHATKAIKERYYTIVKDLVARLIGRAGNTVVQVP